MAQERQEVGSVEYERAVADAPEEEFALIEAVEAELAEGQA
jgi:hypothetical protein